LAQATIFLYQSLASRLQVMAASGTRRIYVMRHGEKSPNVASRENFSLELLPEGLESLAELKAFLDAFGVRFGRVLCSPFLRAVQTAKALVECVEIETGLCEVLADELGLRDGAGGASLEVLREKIDEVVRASSSSSSQLVATSELVRDEDADTCVQCQERALTLVRRLREEHFDKGPLLLVTHGGCVFGLITALCTDSAQPFDVKQLVDMGSMTALDFDGQSWKVVGSVVPVRREGGVECVWSRSSSFGADSTKL